MSELTENLRDSGARSECEAYEDRIDAADEIDRLVTRVAELEGALDAIERDGTKEHNAAVGLRSQVAQLLNENKFLSRENTSLRAKNCLLKAAARKHALAALGKGK